MQVSVQPGYEEILLRKSGEALAYSRCKIPERYIGIQGRTWQGPASPAWLSEEFSAPFLSRSTVSCFVHAQQCLGSAKAEQSASKSGCHMTVLMSAYL